MGVVVRNRDAVANNGRQYGGVAFFYKLSSSSFKQFALTNPDGHEVLATVRTVKGVKGKVFCITAYAPPNLTLPNNCTSFSMTLLQNDSMRNGLFFWLVTSIIGQSRK